MTRPRRSAKEREPGEPDSSRSNAPESGEPIEMEVTKEMIENYRVWLRGTHFAGEPPSEQDLAELQQEEERLDLLDE